jgi:hypothetical protein
MKNATAKGFVEKCKRLVNSVLKFYEDDIFKVIKYITN